jgi:hypothetical protein
MLHFAGTRCNKKKLALNINDYLFDFNSWSHIAQMPVDFTVILDVTRRKISAHFSSGNRTSLLVCVHTVDTGLQHGLEKGVQ